jgi:hypothetical protein
MNKVNNISTNQMFTGSTNISSPMATETTATTFLIHPNTPKQF